MLTVVAVAVALVCGAWVLGGCLAVRMIRNVPRLAALRPALPDRSARVSVVVPCRDEVDTLPSALQARLADPDPALQFVLVDDRSADGTGRVIDQAADADGRVTAMHVTELAPGWLGKVAAMQRGVEVADGDWLLFTDADVHLAPGTIRRAVDWCEQEGLDFLTVFPQVWSSGFALDSTVATFGRMFVLSTRAWAVPDPKSEAFLGVGAFNLVRRAAFERTAGLEWLRMEVADDLALGKLMKSSGAACGLAVGTGLIGLHWYRTVPEMAVGLEKNTFAALNCSLPRILALAAAGLFFDFAPLVALHGLGVPGLRVLGALAVGCGLVTSVVMSRWSRSPALASLTWPLGSVLLAFVLVRAGIMGALRGGIRWRGTFHSSAELRRGRRI